MDTYNRSAKQPSRVFMSFLGVVAGVSLLWFFLSPPAPKAPIPVTKVRTRPVTARGPLAELR